MRVLIASRKALLRDALGVAIEADGAFRAITEVAGPTDVLAQAGAQHPDVIVLDSETAGASGSSTIRTLREEVPDARILLIAEREDVDELAAALEAGATGYLTTDSDLDDLVDSLRAVVDGETFIPGCMLGSLLGRYIVQRRLQRDALARTAELTRRERQVLCLLAQGADTKGIARELVISPETARTHAQNILGKLGVHSRLEAAALVSESGILEHLSPEALGGDGR